MKGSLTLLQGTYGQCIQKSSQQYKEFKEQEKERKLGQKNIKKRKKCQMKRKRSKKSGERVWKRWHVIAINDDLTSLFTTRKWQRHQQSPWLYSLS